MINDVENLFICFLTICMSCLEKVSSFFKKALFNLINLFGRIRFNSFGMQDLGCSAQTLVEASWLGSCGAWV